MSDFIKRCSLDYCKKPLSTLDSIATGICPDCLKDLESDNHYTGICWVCNRITLIDEIPHKLKRVFKDKYLFTNGCSKCTLDGTDDAWITFDRFEPKEQLVVNPKGELVTVSRNKGLIAETELPETDTLEPSSS
jgi:hypothetical protein